MGLCVYLDIYFHTNFLTNGNVWELHTQGQNCDKQQYY